MTISEEVWINMAVLHRTHPERDSFTEAEIKNQVRALAVHPHFRTGVQWHISLHTVANLAPNPAKVRMLYKLPDCTYRLYRPGDDSHPQRTGPTHPRKDDLPEGYRDLLTWYLTEYCAQATPSKPTRDLEDPLLAMSGVGSEIWEGIDVDEYVRELRRDTDEPPTKSQPTRSEKLGALKRRILG